MLTPTDITFQLTHSYMQASVYSLSILIKLKPFKVEIKVHSSHKKGLLNGTVDF